ncbi:skeletal aspartic acid-rich protein 1-like [Oculina patagonica]
MSFGRGFLLTFYASFLIACCTGKDVELSGGGVQCKILGQSGKIMIELIGNDTKGDFSEPNEDRLTFEVDEIKEIDLQGNVVGKIGPKKHFVNTLASQMFLFSKGDNLHQGIKVINVNLLAFLFGPQAALHILVFLFLESGNVTFGNESFFVYNGTLKFNIKITDWEFCDAALQNCGKGSLRNETEAFIDLTLHVESKGTPKKESMEDRKKSKKKPICHNNSSCPDVYDMGGGSDVVLNNEILIDGESIRMPDGFLKFVTEGYKKLFTFRIPKFNNTVVIDPAVNLGGSEGGGDLSEGENIGGEDPYTTSPGNGGGGDGSEGGDNGGGGDGS